MRSTSVWSQGTKRWSQRLGCMTKKEGRGQWGRVPRLWRTALSGNEACGEDQGPEGSTSPVTICLPQASPPRDSPSAHLSTRLLDFCLAISSVHPNIILFLHEPDTLCPSV